LLKYSTDLMSGYSVENWYCFVTLLSWSYH